LHGREQQAEKGSDDGDDDEQFDNCKGERLAGAILSRAHASSPFCRAGQGKMPRLSGWELAREGSCQHADRMPVTEASESFRRQAGLLAYGYQRLRTTFPRHFEQQSPQWYACSEASPITAAAPQRICTAFPFVLASQ
jgi:hypothetical protein